MKINPLNSNPENAINDIKSSKPNTNRMVDMIPEPIIANYGVLYLGCSSLNLSNNKPSLLIA